MITHLLTSERAVGRKIVVGVAGGIGLVALAGAVTAASGQQGAGRRHGAAPAFVQLRGPALAEAARGVRGRVLIGLKPAAAPRGPVGSVGRAALSVTQARAAAEALAARHRLQVRKQFTLAPIVAAEADPGVLDSLLADPSVAYVTPERVYRPSVLAGPRRAPPSRRVAGVPGALFESFPWGVAAIHTPEARALGRGYRGAGATVGILDTGGDGSHPELAYAGGYDAVTGSSAPNQWADDNPACDGHGTHVAGTVAAVENDAEIVGVAPAARIFAIRVFEHIGTDCVAFTSNVITGLEWAVGNGIRVVNLSFGRWAGDGPDPAEHDAIRAARAAGVLAIVAAGNDGAGVGWPALYPEVLSVGALDERGERISFSNFGPELDISAPGLNILSTVAGGGYGDKSGTSMATPHVVGVAALILGANPGSTPDQIETRLLSTAVDVGAQGPDDETGRGRVDALRAVQSLAPTAQLAYQIAADLGSSGTVTFSPPAGGAGTVTVNPGRPTVQGSAAYFEGQVVTVTAAPGPNSRLSGWTGDGAGCGQERTCTFTLTANRQFGVGFTTSISDTLRLSVDGAGQVAGPGFGPCVNSGSPTPTICEVVLDEGQSLALTATPAAGMGQGPWVNAPGCGSNADCTFTLRSDTSVVKKFLLPGTASLSPTSARVTLGTGCSDRTETVTLTASAPTATGPLEYATAGAGPVLVNVSPSGQIAEGRAALTYQRLTCNLEPGRYIDTLSVTVRGLPGAAGGAAQLFGDVTATPLLFVDTLEITPSPVSISLADSGRRTTLARGGPADADSVEIVIVEPTLGTQPWTATKTAPWATLTVASGRGSGRVRWTRDPAGLAVGEYVDTITITAPGAINSPVRFLDTLVIQGEGALVSLDVALAAILGETSLTTEQAGALDAAGNRNERYDVGDLLAYIARSGGTVPPLTADGGGQPQSAPAGEVRPRATPRPAPKAAAAPARAPARK